MVGSDPLAHALGHGIPAWEPVVLDVSPGSRHLFKVHPENGSHLRITKTHNHINSLFVFNNVNEYNQTTCNNKVRGGETGRRTCHNLPHRLRHAIHPPPTPHMPPTTDHHHPTSDRDGIGSGRLEFHNAIPGRLDGLGNLFLSGSEWHRKSCKTRRKSGGGLVWLA